MRTQGLVGGRAHLLKQDPPTHTHLAVIAPRLQQICNRKMAGRQARSTLEVLKSAKVTELPF